MSGYRIYCSSVGFGGNPSKQFYVELITSPGTENVLVGSEGAIEFLSVDNNEDKYAPIKATAIELSVLADSNFNLQALIENESQYTVNVHTQSSDPTVWDNPIIWTGLLSVEDCTEEMVDGPKRIVLKATDYIGRLKEVKYAESDGTDPYKITTLLHIIENCLYQTGLSIPLIVQVNIFEVSMLDRGVNPVNEPFKQCQLHTRGLMDSATTYLDCYEVLSRIMTGFKATLMQVSGSWVIVRMHDYWYNNKIATVYPTFPYTTATATYVNNDYTLTIDKVSRFPVVQNTRGYLAPAKSTRITYNYDIPSDIPRNRQFEGPLSLPLSGADNRANTIDYWGYQYGSNSSPTGSTATPYRNQVYDSVTHAIKETYIVLPEDVTGPTDERLVSSQVEVGQNDRVTLSFDFRQKFGYSGPGNQFLAKIVFRADGGTNYSLDYDVFTNGTQDVARWQTGLGQVVLFNYGSGDNTGNWYSVEIPTAPFPEDGTVEFWFYEGSATNHPNQTWLRNINFDFQLYDSTISKLKGEYDLITTSDLNKKAITEEIKVGDSPRKIISGTLLRMDGSLTFSWYNYLDGSREKLIRVNNKALWQANYRIMSRMDVGLAGCLFDNFTTAIYQQVLSSMNLIAYTASPLINKKFIISNLNLSLGQNQATTSQLELIDSSLDSTTEQGDSQTFSYIYE